ncbi:MAG: hypothetical protein ACYC1E_17615, partial [Propionibacteriaceae bacterium]
MTRQGLHHVLRRPGNQWLLPELLEGPFGCLEPLVKERLAGLASPRRLELAENQVDVVCFEADLRCQHGLDSGSAQGINWLG